MCTIRKRAVAFAQAMTWINLVAMVAFLFNGLMSVVTAALADLNIYPKVTAEVGGDDYEGSWIEHSEV